jgi:putative NIF3 family GTP cyclohydrolase 1 type 2
VTILTPPRHPLVERALQDARQWCAGHVIDSRPALAHAVRVAVTIGEHVADPAAELTAAVLLHDSPEFAPADVDLDTVLTGRYGAEVLRIVRALEAEHHALDSGAPVVTVDDLPVLLASTADKIVALGSLRHRAVRSGDPVGFFAARPGLLVLLPYFQECRTAGVGRVPASMTDAFGRVLDVLAVTARGAG